MKFLSAKQDELEKWKHFNVYIEVPDQGQERINGRWVCTKKKLLMEKKFLKHATL